MNELLKPRSNEINEYDETLFLCEFQTHSYSNYSEINEIYERQNSLPILLEPSMFTLNKIVLYIAFMNIDTNNIYDSARVFVRKQNYDLRLGWKTTRNLVQKTA